MPHDPRSTQPAARQSPWRPKAPGHWVEERGAGPQVFIPLTDVRGFILRFLMVSPFLHFFLSPFLSLFGYFFFPSNSSFFFYLVQEWHILFLSFGTFLETGSLINWIYQSLTLFSLFILLKPPPWSARVHSRPLQAVLRIAVKVRVWLTLFLMCHVYLKITQNLTQRHLFDQKRKNIYDKNIFLYPSKNESY